MTRTIAVNGAKGGCGKTNIAAALALCLARRGNRVGLLDGDTSAPDLMHVLQLKHGDVSLDTEAKKILPLDLGNGVSVFSVAMAFPEDVGTTWQEDQRKRYIESCFRDVDWGDPDYLVIDLAPGHTPEAAFLRYHIKHDALVVVSPASTSLLDTSKLLKQLKRLRIPVIGVIENLASHVCPCGRESFPFGKSDVEDFCQKYGTKLLGKIPFLASDDDGRPLAALLNDPTINAVCDSLNAFHIPTWAKV